MKKTIFTAFALGAMVLAGCTKVETVDVPESRAIAFDNFVTNSVKSLNEEGVDFTAFFVYGGPSTAPTLFNGREVNYETINGTPGWYYDETEYWDGTNTYDFAAYSYENSTVEGVTFANKHLSIPLTNVDGTKDLIYTYESNITSGGDDGKVNFDFHHILSRVAFKFTKDATLDGTNITISNLQITSISNSGTFTGAELTDGQYPYSCWDNKAGNATQEFENSTSMVLTDDALELTTDYEYLIPQSAGTNVLEVTFTLTPSGKIVTDYGKSAIECKVNLPATTNNQWNPGYTYVYTATVLPSNFELEPIVFDVNEIKNWDADDSNGDFEIEVDNN